MIGGISVIRWLRDRVDERRTAEKQVNVRRTS